MKFRIVVNPTAGRGRAARLADRVHEQLEQAGADSSVQFTSAKGEAESLTRRILDQAPPRPDEKLCVVGCGGDGTIQEMVNALLGHPNEASARMVLGVIPTGRCNDFASAFAIPSDPDAVARMLLNGHTRRIDVGRVNQHYFCTVATMGFDSAVSRFVNDMKMPITGTLAYLYGILRVLPRYKLVDIRLIADETSITGPVFLVASANTSSYGGRLRICPNANAEDGILDLCLISPVSRWRVLRLLHRILRSRHTSLPDVRFLRSRSVRIESSTTQEIWADGEFIAETPVTIEAVAGALEMVVPQSLTG